MNDEQPNEFDVACDQVPQGSGLWAPSPSLADQLLTDLDVELTDQNREKVEAVFDLVRIQGTATHLAWLGEQLGDTPFAIAFRHFISGEAQSLRGIVKQKKVSHVTVWRELVKIRQRFLKQSPPL